MVGITDIPDWCYVEAFGKGGLNSYSEAPSAQDLNVLYRCSPIAHLSKVFSHPNLKTTLKCWGI
jgi:acylaminoacyl-peptidase